MIKYKLGDFVRFVDEKMEGFVTRIIDDRMIGVTGADDFEIPVPAGKVTYVHGYEPAGGVKTNDAGEHAGAAEEFKTNGLFVAAVNDPRATSVVHFYLVNETSFELLATLSTQKQDTFKGEFSGTLAPRSAAKLYSAPLADLQLWPKLIFRVLFFTAQNIAAPPPLEVVEKFKAKDFSGAKKLIPLLNQHGWLIRLDQPEIVIDAEKIKESFFKPAAEKVILDKPGSEIDLHIEKLRSDYQMLNSSEILKSQVLQFNKSLDAALVHQLPEITFIHGAGNGILRHEIHKLLSKHQKIQTFMDARKEKFGYGATRVVLK